MASSLSRASAGHPEAIHAKGLGGHARDNLDVSLNPMVIRRLFPASTDVLWLTYIMSAIIPYQSLQIDEPEQNSVNLLYTKREETNPSTPHTDSYGQLGIAISLTVSTMQSDGMSSPHKTPTSEAHNPQNPSHRNTEMGLWISCSTTAIILRRGSNRSPKRLQRKLHRRRRKARWKSLRITLKRTRSWNSKVMLMGG